MINKKRVVIGLTGLVGQSLCSAQEVEELPETTVLARRIESEKTENASSVSIISGEDLERMQRYRLQDSLDLIPGVQGLSTAGLTGNTGTIIVRGLPTAYQQVVIDGVRIASEATGIGNFLANSQVGSISGLEILKGPQSVLYGSGAGGGVIGYNTAVGDSEPKTSLFSEVGSFDSYRAGLASSGKLDQISYGFEIGKRYLEGDLYGILSAHEYDQDYANLALQWQVSDDLRLKLTYRGTDNVLDYVSEFDFGSSPTKIETETSLFALNAFYQVNSVWKTRLTLGYYQENYLADFNGFLAGIDYERFNVNWNNEFQLNDQVTVVAGLEYSNSDFSNSSGRSADFNTIGGYANLYIQPVEQLLFDFGGRFDYHQEFRENEAWNLGAVYSFSNSGLQLHARMGDSYRNPSRLESERFLTWRGIQFANPNLHSEEIKGFEIGLEQSFQNHQFSITFFEQELTDPIVNFSGVEEKDGDGNTVAIGSQMRNAQGEAVVSGLEIEAAGAFLNERLKYRLAYTAQFKDEVLDLPDYLFSADLSYHSDDWMVGIGCSINDEALYGSIETFKTSYPGLGVRESRSDSYVLTRLYGDYQLTENFGLQARIENLFDESYRSFGDTFGESSPIEGEGRAFYVGATLTW